MKHVASVFFVYLANTSHGFVIRTPVSRFSLEQMDGALGSKPPVVRRSSALQMFDDGIVATLGFAITGLGIGVGLLSMFPPSSLLDDDDDEEDIDLSEEDIKSLTEKLRYKTKVGDGRNADLVKGDDRMDRITKLWYEGTRFKNSGSVKNEYAPYGAEKHRNPAEIVATVGALNQNYLNGLSDKFGESHIPAKTDQLPVLSRDDYLSQLSYKSIAHQVSPSTEPLKPNVSKASTVSSVDYLKSLSAHSVSSPVRQRYSPYKSQKGKESSVLPNSVASSGYLAALSRTKVETVSSETSEKKSSVEIAGDQSRSRSYLDALSGAPSAGKPVSYLPFNRAPQGKASAMATALSTIAGSGSNLNYLDSLTTNNEGTSLKSSYLPFKNSKTGCPSALPYNAGRTPANMESDQASSGSSKPSQMSPTTSKNTLSALGTSSYLPFKATWKTSHSHVNGVVDRHENKLSELTNTNNRATTSISSSEESVAAGTNDVRGNYLQTLGGGGTAKVSSYGPGQWRKLTNGKWF